MKAQASRWILAATAAAITSALLIPLPGDPSGGQSRLLDGGHALLGGALALALLPLLRARFPTRPWASHWWAGGIATAYLGLLELVQGALGTRTASATDLLIDALGAGGFLALDMARAARGRRRVGPLLAGAVLLLVALAPAALHVWDRLAARRAFPLLASLEGPLELERFTSHGATLSRDASWQAHGRYSLRVDLAPGPWPGVVLRGMPPDWRGYTALVMELRVDDGNPLTVDFKLADGAHQKDQYSDRYNARFALAPGKHTLRIPLADVAAAPRTRTLDLADVRWVEWFIHGLPEPRSLWLDHLRLE